MANPAVSWPRIITALEQQGYRQKAIAREVFLSPCVISSLKNHPGHDPFYLTGYRIEQLHDRVVLGHHQPDEPEDLRQIVKDMQCLGLTLTFIARSIDLKRSRLHDFVYERVAMRHGPATRLIALHRHITVGWQKVMAGMMQEKANVF